MTRTLQLIIDHFGGANVHENDTIADLGGDELTPIELLPDDAITLETTAGEIVATVEQARVGNPLRKDAA